MGDMAGILAILCIFGLPLSIPILKIWSKHQREMLELRMRLREQGSGNVQADIQALRQEIHALRETSMQYDLSFDAALQRLEQRVVRTEQGVQNTVSAAFRPSYDTNEVIAGLHGDNR